MNNHKVLIADCKIIRKQNTDNSLLFTRILNCDSCLGNIRLQVE